MPLTDFPLLQILRNQANGVDTFDNVMTRNYGNSTVYCQTLCRPTLVSFAYRLEVGNKMLVALPVRSINDAARSIPSVERLG
jgi:hypothetical protein